MPNNNRPIYIATGLMILASVVILLVLALWGMNRPQNAAPSKADSGDVTKCQGNPNAPAKCFDCKKDTNSDQVNVLDFTCFRKYYGQAVGK